MTIWTRLKFPRSCSPTSTRGDRPDSATNARQLEGDSKSEFASTMREPSTDPPQTAPVHVNRAERAKVVKEQISSLQS